MKTFCSLITCCLVLVWSATAASLDEAKKLAKEGNHREAANAFEAILKDEAASSETLVEALSHMAASLLKLDAAEELERVTEEALTRHANAWELWAKAADVFDNLLPHNGMVLQNAFHRGAGNNNGRFVFCQLRDHVRAMQLVFAARAKMPANTDPEKKAKLFATIARVLFASAEDEPWKLQALTDLNKLPDYDDRDQSGSRMGWPVDEKNEPVFFKLPLGYEAAASDGERLRFALGELGSLSPANGALVRAGWATLLKRWFSVETLSDVIGGNAKDHEQQSRDSIAALHTLSDVETSMLLATGARRFKLPPDAQFVRMLREAAVAKIDENQIVGDTEFGDPGIVEEALDALVAELLSRRQFNAAADELKAAMARTKDDERRKQLQAQLDQIEGSWGRFTPMQAQAAGAKAKLNLVFRNSTQAGFVARKVDTAKLIADTIAYLKTKPAPDGERPPTIDSLASDILRDEAVKYLSEPVATWSEELNPAANHWDKEVTLTTPLQAEGTYLIEATFNGTHPARALLWLAGMTIVETKQPDGVHYFVADAVTGAAVSKAKVSFFGCQMERKNDKVTWSFDQFEQATDKDGVAKVSKTKLHSGGWNSYQWLVVATDAQGRLAHSGFQRHWFNDDGRASGANDRVYLVTDRPVYRPGQEVKWKLWARRTGYASKLTTNAFAGSRVHVTITNQRQETMFDKDLRLDDLGALEGMLALDSGATLGIYNLQVRLGKNGPFGSQQFRVEEYKKPEFEVKVEAPEKPVALGEAFEFKVKADYYFGGPVKQATVKYSVKRQPHRDRWWPEGRWDWLFGSGYGWRGTSYAWYPGNEHSCVIMPRHPWFSWGYDPEELIAQGEVPIGADGTATVKIETALAKELHGDQDHRYEIDVEVTDSSRRTIRGEGMVIASRRPFEVYVWMDRGWYQTGDDAEAKFEARTLDGREVKTTGEWRVVSVSYDAEGKPAETEVLHSDAEPAPLKWKWPKPGQYRVTAKLKDEAGHEVEASSFVVVRGESFDGKDFRFDDLEVIASKTEYQPGEEVELLINTNHVDSTVALFVRGTSHDPVWLHPKGRSLTYRTKVTDSDQPNFFIEAYSVSDARLHKATCQILVPPGKRIATVELTTSKPAYLPRDQAKTTLKVKDQNGKPFVGDVVLTGYDKALEYISGGSNVSDIRPFFWGWKRSREVEIRDSLQQLRPGIVRDDEEQMASLGLGGGGRSASFADPFATGYAETASTVNAPVYRGMRFGGAAIAPETVDGLIGGKSAMAVAPPPSAFAAAPAAGSFASGGLSKAQPVMLRTNLADSAVWVTHVKTSKAGEATLEFPMPDNLTTWKLRGWVIGSETQVGEASVEVVTRKDLMVRLQSPRFFVQGDEATVSVNVHNETSEVMQTIPVLEAGGAAVELRGGTDTPFPIMPHSEIRFDWRLRAMEPGQLKLTARALSEDISDAMQMSFPVIEHGLLKTESWSLALRGDEPKRELSFEVPVARKPESTRLEVRWSPTLAMAMVDALPYLADYPYGCTEQTLNRFVPTVITMNVLKDMGIDLKSVRDKRTNLNAQEVGDAKKRGQRWQGKDDRGKTKNPVFDEAEVQRMAEAGLKKLVSMQNADGGWGWFPGARESSAHMTALVTHGLMQARGMKVPQPMLDKAKQWLSNHEAEQLARLKLPGKDKNHKAAPDDTDMLVHCALADLGAGSKEMRDALYAKREGLSRLSVAMLGLVCDAMKEREQRDMCLRNLQQFVKQDDAAQTAWLELPNDGWWHWWNDRIETQASFLKLLCKTGPKGDLAARVAKHLLNNRRNGSFWNSTRDTSAVIEALAAFVKASGESKPEMKLDVLLDGEVKKQVSIDRKNLFSFDNTLVLEGEAVGTGRHTLELRREGKGPVYASTYLTLFSQEEMIPAAGLDVKVRRKFYKLTEQATDNKVSGSRGQVIDQQGVKFARTELKSGELLKSGDLVEVELLIESSNDYEYVLLADPKPAGFEPVEVQSGWVYEAMSSYREFRDDKVAFFVPQLAQGRSTVSYRVKAEIPGEFHALPAKVEAMYAPELRGNADEWKTVIEDR